MKGAYYGTHRHIALLTKDTEKPAEFYKTSFGLNEVARSGEMSENGHAIYLSDGHINLAILPAQSPRGNLSFRHEVEDVKGAAQFAKGTALPGYCLSCPAPLCRNLRSRPSRHAWIYRWGWKV
jgi:catechol 2,3-dioxygenase-like lactoylglutathione lyase family enzyme